MSNGLSSATVASPWDPLVEELQTLRLAAGNPSYGRLAQLITDRRVAAGAAPAAARIARSTVFDLFRVGRPRVNLALAREAALVLGASDSTVDDWIRACQAPDPAPDAEPGWRGREVALLMAACLALNLLGRTFVDFFAFPVYLDMVGTAIAAIALGPWRGAAVGVATNVVGVLGSGWISLPFAVCNVVGALVWGYGTHRFGMGRTLPRFFLLSVTAALACSVAAVPVIVLFTGGADDLRVGHDVITSLVSDSVDTFVLAVGLSNVLTSTADKLISGFTALVLVTALPWRLRHRLPLVLADQRTD